jgi:hypothetical protein
MARTNLPLSALVANGGLADPAGTAIDVTNGMNVAIPATSIPSGSGLDKLILRVANTAGAAKNTIVRKGVDPPAFRASIGDLTVQVPATTGVRWIGPFEIARFAQSDGSLNIDFEAATAGTITAFIAPSAV